MKTTHYFVSLLTGVLAALPALSSARNKGPEPVLTERGQVLEKTYSDQLDAINKEISAALPVIDAQKKDAFETARAELGALKAPRADDAESVHKAYHEAKPLAEASELQRTITLLTDEIQFTRRKTRFQSSRWNKRRWNNAYQILSRGRIGLST